MGFIDLIKYFKEKIVGSLGSISGAASILGSWQVCHNICLGIIVLLSIIGIGVVGMPLAFLTKIVVPVWIAALVLLLVAIGIYFKKRCISSELLTFNSGLIIAGVPFQPLQKFSVLFWVVGGFIAFIGISLFIRDKIRRKNEKRL